MSESSFTLHLSERHKEKKYFCTDCSEVRLLRPDGRCTMCGGARVIGPVKEQKGAATMSDIQYAGMSYEQASREAARLIDREGWFRGFEKLAELHTIMVRELRAQGSGNDERY